MNIYSLMSGSKGNCTLIETTNYNILIDVGHSLKQIDLALLSTVGYDVEMIDFIAITHVHSDHIKSFNTIYNRYPTITFLTNKTLYKSIVERMSEIYKKPMEYDSERFIFINGFSKGNNLNIGNFELEHDVYCLGWYFVDKYTNESMVFIADNGSYPYRFRDMEVSNIPFTYYMIESNYDEFLQYQDTKRNSLLKRRVLSTKGHSNNFQAVEKLIHMLEQSNNKECKGVMFTHLSEECNTPQIAQQSHDKYIETWGHKTITKDIDFKYALQDEVVSF